MPGVVCRCLVLAMVLKESLRDAQVSHGSVSQNPSQEGTASRVETPYG